LLFVRINTDVIRVMWLYWTIACLGCVFVLIAVHETGHFLAGWLGGIPARDMRLRLLTFPQHVALRVDGTWVSPSDFEPYLAKMRACLPTSPRLFFYTAGGFLLETVFAVAAVSIALTLGFRWPAQVVALCSAWLLGSYVLFRDLPFTMRYRVPCGDLSGLWWVAPVPAAVLAAVLLAVRAFLLWASFAELGAAAAGGGM
jgi:hypothetical protein